MRDSKLEKVQAARKRHDQPLGTVHSQYIEMVHVDTSQWYGLLSFRRPYVRMVVNLCSWMLSRDSSKSMLLLAAVIVEIII